MILSSVFGVKTDVQTNSQDPLIAKARKALSQSLLQKLLFPVVSTLPFGQWILNKEFISRIFFSNFFPSLKVAQEMIDVKRQGGASGRKVSF